MDSVNNENNKEGAWLMRAFLVPNTLEGEFKRDEETLSRQIDLKALNQMQEKVVKRFLELTIPVPWERYRLVPNQRLVDFLHSGIFESFQSVAVDYNDIVNYNNILIDHGEKISCGPDSGPKLEAYTSTTLLLKIIIDWNSTTTLKELGKYSIYHRVPTIYDALEELEELKKKMGASTKQNNQF